MDQRLLKRVLAIRSVPPHIIIATAVASYGGQLFGTLQGWPIWAIGLATLLPWVPLFTAETVWTYRHYTWLALFYVLTITQLAHFGEHVAQMVQIHVLGLSGAAARGIFGALNIEWVHFLWNSWVLLAVVLLLGPFRANPWLRVLLVVAGWHELEHTVIMATYLTTGVAGTPGLLAKGGILGGGLPLSRADLHFIYNFIETVPLVIAFVYQLRHSYDEWLKRAFPHLPDEVLIETTNQLQPLRFAPGARILRQGDPADRFFVLCSGEVAVLRQDDSGQEREVATLGPGQYFGEIGLLSNLPRTASIVAKTTVEVLALNREAFQGLINESGATAEDFATIARRRLSETVSN